MLINLIELMILIVISSILQKNYKIPSPVTLLSIVMFGILFNYKFFKLNAEQFDNIVILTLPLLIVADALKLKWKDLKEEKYSLFWIAIVSVLLSIIFGVLVNDLVLISYPLSIAAVILLFSMVSATDPITVSAIFSTVKVPHKLKVLTEGESLFNDATALIVFSIALVALSNPEDITIKYILIKSFKVLFGAIAIGIVLGYVTTILLKLSNEVFIETTIILLSAYVSYIIAEHYHFSGILAVIVSAIISNKVIQKSINIDDENIKNANKNKNYILLKYSISSKENHENIIKSVDFLSLFASSILFISIASIANINKLMEYKYEIISVFIATTIIRGILMLKFTFLSNKVTYMRSIKSHWWSVLTFAGSKGALSILMVHLIPSSFKYKELFENIIIGNIFLSIFVYALILAIIINKNKEKFMKECKEEEESNELMSH